MQARHFFQTLFGVTAGCLLLAANASPAEKSSAERGRDIMFHKALTPSVWTLKSLDELWKVWGLSSRPEYYPQALRERYGLQTAPFDNGGRPLGLLEAPRFPLGKGIINNCLLCHAGSVAGQTIIGAPNSTLDLQSFFEDLTAADGYPWNLPFQFSYVRGTIDAVNPSVYLTQFRDAELNVQKPRPLPFSRNVCSDPPAWWLLKKKKTRDWSGLISARSTRVDMVNLFTPLNSGDYIKKQEQAFADISAFLLSIEAPKYPFSIDAALAAHGKGVFKENCARCHGSYGPEGHYPNKIVPLEEIGTDPVLQESVTPQFVEIFNQSWLAREIGEDGKPIQATHQKGYQAPPLDGIWATAPYLHNSSAPTVYHVLNSKARPRFFTRSYRTGKEDYDTVKLGWKITVLNKGADAKAPGYERRKIYDTTRPGQSNGGHTFGDELTEEERMAVIEYLKTL
ncbi:MAG TPA: hypothetical protein VGY66_13360 [Gemmataceae bacterium]|jgi:mono/diheme cytochrome c family protein|nr:hypothetical protein [Gemmataceae bacterium]